MTSFSPDQRTGTVNAVAGPFGTVSLDGLDSDGSDVDIRAVQLTAEQWGREPNGAVYSASWDTYSSPAAFVSLHIDLPSGTRAFSFYATHGFSDVDDLFVNAYIEGCRTDNESCVTAGADVVVDGAQGSRQVTVTTSGNRDLDKISISNYHRSVLVGGFAIRTTPDPVRYLTLGDSYSSGEAAPNDDGKYDAEACHRSTNAWASWVDWRSDGLELVANRACSGAEISALTSSFKQQPAQLSVFQGQGADVDLVTVTLGGNDIRFAHLIGDCYLSSACQFNLNRTRRRLDTPDGLGSKLRRSYAKINAAMKKAGMVDAHLVVVGYPAIFPATQGEKRWCGWLSSNELRAAHLLAVRLDEVLNEAATSAGASYVSTLTTLRGHEECSKDPWMYSIGPLGGSQRGHPTLLGQQAIATEVARALS